MSLWHRRRRQDEQPGELTGMACQECVELVSDYLEGTLEPELIERAEAHLGECRACLEYLEQMRLTVAELAQMPTERLSAQSRAELLSAFREWSAGAGSSP